MPSILKIRVSCARDLPVMDRASELADAYAEIRFGDLDPQRSPIARKTLNPVWNHDFRLEIADDSVLQSEPLEIRVLDYDAITANDAVGSVLIDLDPLLGLDSSTGGGGAGAGMSAAGISGVGAGGLAGSATATAPSGMTPGGGSSEIRGWFPLYDTLRGIRGEVYVTVRLQFFGNANPFKDSSAGVQFFTSPQIPSCYQLTTLSGFVDALLIDDDPEYHWTDSFRTPRASNESRQKLLCRMSCQLRRLMGKKALELGANAIVGYQQCFDLENETKNIVARAIGTACLVTPVLESASGDAEVFQIENAPLYQQAPEQQGQDRAEFGGTHQVTESPMDVLASPVRQIYPPQTPSRSNTMPPRTSAEDPASSAFAPLPSPTIAPNSSVVTPMTPTTLLRNPPPGLSQPVPATPAAAAAASPPVPPARTTAPTTTPATGTAAATNTQRRRRRRSLTHWLEHPILLTTLTRFPAYSIVNLAGLVTAKSVKLLSTYDSTPAATRDAWWGELRDEVRAHAKHLRCTHVLGYSESTAIHDDLVVLSATGTAANLDPTNTKAAGVCRLTHVPYPARSTTLHAALATCAACGRRPVPPLVLATVDPPLDLPASVGPGVLIEAHVLRPKKKKDGETNAALVSDAIPFAEFDLHRQLTGKLRAVGGNAVFGLKVQLVLGDEHLVAVATGTAFRLPWIPGPEPVVAGGLGSGSGLMREGHGTNNSNGNKAGGGDASSSSDSDSDSSTSSVSVTGLGLGLAGVPDSSYTPSVLHNNAADDPLNNSSDALNTNAMADPAMLGSVTYNCAPPALHIPAPGPMFAHQIVVAVRQALLSAPSPTGVPGDASSKPDARPSSSFASATNRRSLSGAAASAAAAVAASAGGLLGGAGGGGGGGGGPSASSAASQAFPVPPPPPNPNALGDMVASNPSASDLFGPLGTAMGNGGAAASGPDRLAAIMNALYMQTSLQFAMLRPCLLAGVSHDVSILDGGVLQVRMVGTVMGRVDVPGELSALLGDADADAGQASILPSSAAAAGFGLGAGLGFGGTSGVEITPLASIPHTRITTYLGRLALHFVKEIAEHHHQSYVSHHVVSHPVPLAYACPPNSAPNAWDPLLAGSVGADDVDAGGMGAFVQTTWTEIMAVVGAHVQALGGNALMAFRVEHSGFHDGLKNQMYALVCVSGDVCSVVPTAGVAAGGESAVVG